MLVDIAEENVCRVIDSDETPAFWQSGGPRTERIGIHWVNPPNIFSASFSSLQNSASNSLAGVGGWYL